MCRPLLLLLSAWMLTACASGVPPTAASWRPPPPPAQDLQPCPELPEPASGRAGDLLANHVAVARLYQACRTRQQGLAEHATQIQKAIENSR